MGFKTEDKNILTVFLLCLAINVLHAQTVYFSKQYALSRDSINGWIKSKKYSDKIHAYNALVSCEEYIPEYYNILLEDTSIIIQKDLKFRISEYYFYKFILSENSYKKCSYPLFKVGIDNFKKSQNRLINFIANLYGEEYDRLSINNRSVHSMTTLNPYERKINLSSFDSILNENNTKSIGSVINGFDAIHKNLTDLEKYYFRDIAKAHNYFKRDIYLLFFKYYLYEKVISASFCFDETNALLLKMRTTKTYYSILGFYYQLISYYYPFAVSSFFNVFQKDLPAMAQNTSVRSSYTCFPVEDLIYDVINENGRTIDVDYEYNPEDDSEIILNKRNNKLPLVTGNFLNCYQEK